MMAAKRNVRRICPLMMAVLVVVIAPHAWAQARLLNDTGIDFCGDPISGQSKPCLGTEPPGQDVHYGRDAGAAAGTLSKLGGGSKGFDFIALDAVGQPVVPSGGASPHPCVRDNVTGLVWEVKTDDSGLHDKDWTFTWYQTGSADGNDGTASGGSCGGTVAGGCDTEKFVVSVNATGWCGYTDWRIPTVKELEGIVDLGGYSQAIDTTYFPNTPGAIFWSRSRYPSSFSDMAWGVRFDGYQLNYFYPRSYAFPVRLVR